MTHNVLGNNPIGALGGVINVSKHMIDTVREVVDEEYYKKYIENSQERDKILNDMIEKQLLELFDKKKEDK